MKIESNKICENTGLGSISLTPEDEDDIWELFLFRAKITIRYNLLSVGDIIKSKTVRKVKSTSTTDVTMTTRKTILLSLKVRKVEYDGEGSSLRVAGINMEENEFVALGARHTIEIKEFQRVTVSKEYWDSVYIEKLREIVKKDTSSELCAIVLQEGLASICKIRNSMCIVKSRIERLIPGKGRGGSAQSEKAMQSFYNMIYGSFVKCVNLSTTKVVLVCSNGFLNQNLVKYMDEESLRGDRIVHSNLSKFITVHSSSGHVYALQEVLKDEKVMSKLDNTKFAEEISVLEKFSEIFRTTPDKVSYGDKSVKYCIDQGAVDVLLVSDKLIRGKSAEIRKRIIGMIDAVRESGGKSYLFSSLHPSGQQLNNLTGIAAILRYSVEEQFESEESSSDSSDIGDF